MHAPRPRDRRSASRCARCPARAARRRLPARRSRSLVDDANDAEATPSLRDEHGASARHVEIVSTAAATSAERAARASVEEPVTARPRPDAADDAPRRRGPGIALEAGALRRLQPAPPRRVRTIARPIGCSDRRFERRRRAQERSSVVAPFSARDRLHAEPSLASASRSCRTPRSVTAASCSRCAPPLISTPLRAAAASAGHDRHRRRDHERARARDHEQHERAIEPRRPARRRAASGGTTATRPRAPARSACRCARSDRRMPGSARAAPARARPGG